MTPEEQIRQLIARYAHVHDVNNVEGLVSLFAEDGAFVGGTEYRGHDAIRAVFQSPAMRRGPDRRGKLMFGNSIITVTGDTAEALTDVVGVMSENDEPWRIYIVASHADRLVRQGERWLFAEKRVQRL